GKGSHIGKSARLEPVRAASAALGVRLSPLPLSLDKAHLRPKWRGRPASAARCSFAKRVGVTAPGVRLPPSPLVSLSQCWYTAESLGPIGMSQSANGAETYNPVAPEGESFPGLTRSRPHAHLAGVGSILVLEDDEDLLSTLRDIMVANGNECVTARS